ncbi:MAG: hypothetical protein WB588_01710 [Dehalococcoidia bacterium]
MSEAYENYKRFTKDKPNLMQKYLKLDKLDDGVITMDWISPGGDCQHYEYYELKDLEEFLRDLSVIVQKDTELLYRPIQAPMGECIRERQDLLLGTQLLFDSMRIIVDFLLAHCPE